MLEMDVDMSMLKQIVVDIETAKGLRRLGYREPCLAYFDFEGKLCNMNCEEAIVRDMNGPKETPGRGPRCYSAPTQTAVQEWLRRKKHYELLVSKTSFFDQTGSYFCRIIRLSDNLSRDTKPRRTYEQALEDGIKQTIIILLK